MVFPVVVGALCTIGVLGCAAQLGQWTQITLISVKFVDGPNFSCFYSAYLLYILYMVDVEEKYDKINVGR